MCIIWIFNTLNKHKLENTFQVLLYVLIHSFIKVFMTSVVWIFKTFEYNFEIKQKSAEYLKGSCGLGSDQQFSFKYFWKKNSGLKNMTKIPRKKNHTHFSPGPRSSTASPLSL